MHQALLRIIRSFVASFFCAGVIFYHLANPPSGIAQQQPAPEQPAPEQPAKQYRYWKTNWSFDSIDVGNVLRRLRQVGISIPIRADGDVTARFSVSVPINALRTGRAYKFSGTLTSNQLQLEQLLLADLRTTLRYENGRLDFSGLSMRWLDRRVVASEMATAEVPPNLRSQNAGTLTGEAAFQLIPLETFTANLTAKSLSLAPVYDLITKATRELDVPMLRGSLSGKVAVLGPLSELGDVNRWTVNANLRGEDLSIDDSPPLTIATGPLSPDNAQLSAESIRLGSPLDPNVRLNASIDASLKDAVPVKFGLRGNDVPLQTLLSLASLGSDIPIVGKLDVDLNGSGQLNPPGSSPTWEVGGRLASPNLMVYGFNLGLVEHSLEFNDQRLGLRPLREEPNPAMIIERIAANYEITEESIQLNSLAANIFQGSISGEAMLAREQTGTHRLDIQWRELRPQLDTAPFFPASVDLVIQTSGNIQWQVPADSLDKLATHQGTASLVFDPIALNESSLGDLRAEIRAGDGEVLLNGSGKLFGGSFEVDTVAPLSADTTIEDLLGVNIPTQNAIIAIRGATQVNLAFNQLDLSRLRALMPGVTPSYAGLISGSVSATLGTNLAIDTKLVVNSLELNNRMLSRRLIADLSVRDSQLTVNSLRGNYASGRIEAVGSVNLARMRGRLNVRLSTVDFSRGVLVISPALAELVGGAISGRAMVDIADAIKIRGAVSVRDNEIFQVRTGQTHANLRVALARDLGSWAVDLRNIEGVVGRGHVAGDLQLASSRLRPGAFDMDSQWTAKRLNFASLLEDFGSRSQYARGEIDGALVIGGNGIRSVAD